MQFLQKPIPSIIIVKINRGFEKRRVIRRSHASLICDSHTIGEMGFIMNA
jgi:hypothetical protein